MPSYDLACESCGSTFEVFRQGFLRAEDRECARCGSGEIRQLFTGFVTSRPAREAPVAGGGGGCCGGSCGCGSG